tara:strand:- start:3112 stop:3216 length:105 start_codon:yes stop_codon:yes gene_type:complete
METISKREKMYRRLREFEKRTLKDKKYTRKDLGF